MTVEFEVYGIPEALPRPRAVRRGLLVGVYQEKPTWMGIMALRAQEVRRETKLAEPLEGPLCVELHLRMRRTVSLPKRKEKPHLSKPDVDNCAKACLDGLVPALIADDKHVVELLVTKRYALAGESPGCTVIVKEARELTVL